MRQSSSGNPDRRLDSWKGIAAFFGRDERTVRRWEKENALPVHRIPGGAKGRVFAYEAELQLWLSTAEDVPSVIPPQEPHPGPPQGEVVEPARRHPQFGATEIWITGLVLSALLAGTIPVYRNAHRFAVQAAVTSPAVKVQGPSQPANSAAEDLYLRGRYYWNKRTPEDLNRAVDYFTQAIVQDPNYAKAYVGLADCYNLLREYSVMPANEAYPRALAAATRAVELDDSSAEAHTSLAFVTFFWNWDAAGAEREFQRALALDPNDARAHHWYASFLVASGRFSEALTQIETARRLDPSSVAVLADKGQILRYLDQPAAVTLLRQVETAEPSFTSAHRYLSEIYFDRKDYADYLSEWKKTALLVHDPQELAVAKAAESGFSQAGYKGMLEGELRIQKRLNQEGLEPAYSLAMTYARLGRKQDALQYLQAAFDQRNSSLLFISLESAFAGLHDNPEYRDIVARLRPSPKLVSSTDLTHNIR